MSFEIIPAIDLNDGVVVRVEQGDLDTAVVYDSEPVFAAQKWQDLGASRLHVVDLQGAVEGRAVHRTEVASIVAGTTIGVQVGGGIRSVAAITEWLNLGVERVVIGTAAITDPDFLAEALDLYADSVVVALDSRDSELRLKGWTEGSGLQLVPTAVDLARRGVRRLLVTDIARDGMLTGPNIEQLAAVAGECGIPVIASGGVSSVADLAALATVPGIEGAIVGRALYTGAVDLTEALTAVR